MKKINLNEVRNAILKCEELEYEIEHLLKRSFIYGFIAGAVSAIIVYCIIQIIRG